MPKQPKPVDPQHRIDPAHNGDIHAVHAPTNRDGHPVTEKPFRDEHGRDLAPNREHIGRIDRDDFRNNIRREHEHWDVRDHDYHWHDWNGWRACHHYDEFGYHWWGFYVGNVYFWTRYYNDGYWWFDPYWHRWVFMRDGQWWWQSPDNGVYLYTNNNYYQYNNSDAGVVVTPDPTPAVDVPPGDPTPAPVDQTTVYSQDGTRSVQIVGDNRDAYLYDLTADQGSKAAEGRYIGTQVAGVKIDNVTQTAADGTETQAAQQIELSYDDSTSVSIVDVNGQRRVDVSGDAKSAVLNNLTDSTVDPVSLASGVTDTAMTYGPLQDSTGKTVTTLTSIALTVTVDADHVTTLTFDRNGKSLDAPPADEAATISESSQNAPQALQQKFEGSETFRALKAGFGW